MFATFAILLAIAITGAGTSPANKMRAASANAMTRYPAPGWRTDLAPRGSRKATRAAVTHAKTQTNE